MCKWYCTSEGPNTNLKCLHCGTHYCAVCLKGEAGKMESMIKCAKCGRKPRVLPKDKREGWAVGGASSVLSDARGPDPSGLNLRPEERPAQKAASPAKKPAAKAAAAEKPAAASAPAADSAVESVTAGVAAVSVSADASGSGGSVSAAKPAAAAAAAKPAAKKAAAASGTISFRCRQCDFAIKRTAKDIDKQCPKCFVARPKGK